MSEKRLGEFAKKLRKEIFLATKIVPRDRDGALRSVEVSLKFLQSDYIDLIQIHSLTDLSDLDRIGSANGVLAAVQQLKEQKVARYIGITGHNDGTATAEALRRHELRPDHRKRQAKATRKSRTVALSLGEFSTDA